jgi:hypothetical protein
MQRVRTVKCNVRVQIFYTGCPTRYQTRNFFNNFTNNEDIATKFEADVPHCVRSLTTTNVFLFKFRRNIFIGVRIITEKLGSGSEWDTPYKTGDGRT